MHKPALAVLLAFTALTITVSAPPLYAQTGKIFCWKNKSGKTECGDHIPAEDQNAPVKELNSHGVTTGRSEMLTADQRKAQDDAAAKARIDNQQKIEQQRQDKALLDTFSNEQEIEMKRLREAQAINATLEELVNNQKSVNERHNFAQSRIDQLTKSKQTIPAAAKDDLARADKDKASVDQQMVQKKKELVDLNQHYADMKKRYAELTGKSSASAAPTAAVQKK